jgi:hypothetical protein
LAKLVLADLCPEAAPGRDGRDGKEAAIYRGSYGQKEMSPKGGLFAVLSNFLNIVFI